MTVLAAMAGCPGPQDPRDGSTDAPQADASGDAACGLTMPGRVCLTSCHDIDIDGGAPYACEVYCDPVGMTCFTATGSSIGCNVTGSADAGFYVIC